MNAFALEPEESDQVVGNENGKGSTTDCRAEVSNEGDNDDGDDCVKVNGGTNGIELDPQEGVDTEQDSRDDEDDLTENDKHAENA